MSEICTPLESVPLMSACHQRLREQKKADAPLRLMDQGLQAENLGLADPSNAPNASNIDPAAGPYRPSGAPLARPVPAGSADPGAFCGYNMDMGYLSLTVPFLGLMCGEACLEAIP